MSLEDKVAIVTGAARGIGLACAQRLARDGAKIVIADIDEEGGARAAEELGSAGHEALFVSCNVSERLDVHNLMAVVLEAHDRVDVLVNNAAVLDAAPFLQLDEAEFERVLRINVKGSFLVGQAVARQMVRQLKDKSGRESGGSIINMSSVNDRFALPDHVAYTVSKGGISQLTKAMALALAPHRIRVNAVGPGSIMTPMLADVATDDDVRRRILSRTPLGRMGQPEEIAAIVAFLAGEEASYITGTTIYADGGRMPLNYTVDVDED
ncbi:MAG: 3-oxoacyl-ACP reductase FabG [Hyphomicrobiaceae bacterium]|nr:3-oxoacyl-ACP reductase FabG [Hyphomicrobiaceae bacterium]